jgi:1,4-dihydroxy-2-naphthoyl-CoA hydrolase
MTAARLPKSKAPKIPDQLCRGMAHAIGIELSVLTPEKVVATMPVDDRTRQPFGLLHGGASAALAETVASLGAFMSIDEETQAAVGVELNANHIRGKSDGVVTATAIPLHRGRTTHVWEIRIEDEDGKLVCVSRCTLAIVAKRQ